MQYKTKRLAAMQEREKQGWVGKLVKRGEGELTLTAVNAYTGGTEVAQGTLAGLTESFGKAPVVVDEGATLKLSKAFTVTKAGENGRVTTQAVGTDKVRDDAQVVLKKGAVLALADNAVSLKSLTVEGPATLDVTAVKDAEVTFTVDGDQAGLDQLQVAYDKSRYSAAQLSVDGDDIRIVLQAK